MFTFKSKTAESLKVVVNKLPPFKTAQKLVRFYPIEGSDKTEVEELGFQSYNLPCTITLMDLTKLDEVMAWLNGSGFLTRDDDDTKYLKASVYNGVEIQKNKTTGTGSFEFYISDPFRYLLNEADVTITEPTVVANAGTYFSEPLLKITGSGVISVTVGDMTFGYNFGDETEVYIDGAIKEAYYPTVEELKNRKMTGDFPRLEVGNNIVTWTGTVTEIILTKRTRYL